MNCLEFYDGLGLYMEAQLAVAERQDLERHRDACPPCGDLFRLAHEISCREVAEFLDDYVDGRLQSDRRAVFERHLGLCPPCEIYLKGYRSAQTLSRDCENARDEMPADLIAAILAARRAKKA